MNDQLQRLLDRAEIQDLMGFYARAVDRADWKALREVYHPDAIDEHCDFNDGVDGFIEFAIQLAGGHSQAMHFLGQCLVEFPDSAPNPEKDTAVAETYFMTAHTLSAESAKGYRVEGAEDQTV